MARPMVVLSQGVLALDTGKGASIVPGAGGEGVKNFAQAVRTAVVQGDEAPFAHDRPGGETENVDRQE